MKLNYKYSYCLIARNDSRRHELFPKLPVYSGTLC